MPWKEKTPMTERMEFLVDYESGLYRVTELSERYGVSRKTLYKWIGRFEAEGAGALSDRSSRPRTSPTQTSREMEALLVDFRRRHPKWGARKILDVMERKSPSREWPAASTVAAILKRHGLVTQRRRRRHEGHPGRPMTVAKKPNMLWAADFKGHFRTGDGVYCYPLTVTDLFSRYILMCHGLLSTDTEGVQAAYERLFREVGLPEAIRTDNGTPFASNGLARLSRLAVWLLKLGVRPELTQPSHPEQNGCHERMHRTLKDATARPPAGSLRGQQRRFDAFCREFNELRPHEGIGMERPAKLYEPSPRRFPDRLAAPEYPGHFEVRRVSRNGGIRWKKDWLNVSSTLIEEDIGLVEVADGIWSVYFYAFLLGRFDERERRLYGAYSGCHRRRCGRRGNRGQLPRCRLIQGDSLAFHSAAAKDV
jgi:putative transposase